MPALPETIFDTYERCKVGTNSVITFLIQSGRTPKLNRKSKATKRKSSANRTQQRQASEILPSWFVISFGIIGKLHQTLWFDGPGTILSHVD